MLYQLSYIPTDSIINENEMDSKSCVLPVLFFVIGHWLGFQANIFPLKCLNQLLSIRGSGVPVIESGLHFGWFTVLRFGV